MFVHLRSHTEFSVVDGTVTIGDLVKAAAKDGQPALAVTDFNNMFGAVKHYKTARGKGVKPLLGSEVLLTGVPGTEAGETSRIVLLVQTTAGYFNLCEILARAWTRGTDRDTAVVQFSWVQELADGLIALSGAQAGPVGQALLAGAESRATDTALALAQTFPHRFYIEVQRAGRGDDEAHVVAAVQLAARLKLPVVATHPIQFLTADDFESHEARVCIAEGEVLGNPKRVRRFTPQQHFKTHEQMAALFADIPSAIANTVEIARRCNVELVLGKPQLPNFPTPLLEDGTPMSVEQYFRLLSNEGLEERLVLLFPNEAKRNEARPRYQERLEFELGTILKMGFPGYFLIVADFIQWAKNNACPVGPGRGSGAGSLVAYALKITDLDPLQYNLLFERFLNPERVSMPDFDIDFCQGNRDRVIDYVKQKYGKEAVSQIATFGTLAAKAAIRDVGRVMDMSYGFCDGISKLVPGKPGMSYTLAYPPEPKKEGDKNNYALELEPQLYERVRQEEDVRNLIEMAQKLEGLTRNIGMHAGGVVIAPGKLTDFCPLYQQPGSDSAVSQYDKNDVEDIGLVKFDFLGLATLTIMEHARNFIIQRHKGQENFAFENIPLDDRATYELFSDGRTEAVFQFESRGMQAMLKDAKPSRLEDLIALNALYRPGPMDLIPTFIARKHGREEVEYPHPLVEKVLAETYGIMVYQEQVMQTAQVLGGYSLGGADLLRRAMGKKKAEEMAQHRLTFREGAAKNGLNEAKADEVFDLMEKFAGYGFNKSHAAAYSLLAYHTGWLKVHYTAEFFCGNMTVEMDNTDKLKVLYEDALREGMKFEMPDVNHSNYRFEPVSNKVIRYGLGAVKGTGEAAVEAIIAAREGRGTGPQGDIAGPFKSLFDFCLRVDRTRMNKRTLEALIKAGAFDNILRDRASLMASVDLAFEFASATHANANQGGLFDAFDDGPGASTEEPPLVQVAPWGVREQLQHEKVAVGFYLSGHLFDEVEQEVRRFARRRIADLGDTRDALTLAGVVSELRIINGQRGRLAIFKLDDKSATLEATADERVLTAAQNLLKDDETIVVAAVLQPDRFSGGFRLKVTQVWSLAQARCRFGRYLRVSLGHSAPDVRQLIAAHPAQVEFTDVGDLRHGLPVHVQLERKAPEGYAGCAGVSAEIKLGDKAWVFPSDEALKAWLAHAAGGKAEVVYNS